MGQRRSFRRQKRDVALGLRQACTIAGGSVAEFERPEPTIEDSIGHHAEWIQACKTGKPTTCNFEYSGLLAEANHLGNVAFRSGKTLHWDSEKMEAKNHSDAEQFIIGNTVKDGH